MEVHSSTGPSVRKGKAEMKMGSPGSKVLRSGASGGSRDVRGSRKTGCLTGEALEFAFKLEGLREHLVGCRTRARWDFNAEFNRTNNHKVDLFPDGPLRKGRSGSTSWRRRSPEIAGADLLGKWRDVEWRRNPDMRSATPVSGVLLQKISVIRRYNDGRP